MSFCRNFSFKGIIASSNRRLGVVAKYSFVAFITLCFSFFFQLNAHCRARKANVRGRTHVVRRGETLYSISKRFKVSVASLKKTNRISNTIYPGQRLRIYSKKRRRKRKKTAPVLRCCYIWPVKGVVTSRYGIQGGVKKNGITIRAVEGTDIRAMWRGQVVFVGEGPKCLGNMIVIDHGAFFSVYAHNESNKVRKWQRVKSGEVIGVVGGTGCTKEPCLYFEIRRGKKSINPLYYLSNK